MVKIKLFKLNSFKKFSLFWVSLFKSNLFLSNLLQNKPGYVVITFFILIGIYMGGRIFFFDQVEGENTSSLGDLKKSENLTDDFPEETGSSWSDYKKLSQEATSFARMILNWGLRTPNSEPGMGNSENRDEEKYQEILSYRIEVRERSRLNAETLERLQEKLEREVWARMNKKEEQLKKEIETAVLDKKQSLAQELALYKKEIEAEYFLEMTNLRFKLHLPGLPQEDIVKLEQKIEAIKDELNQKTKQKEMELAEEASSFAKRRAVAGEEELIDFEQRLLFEMEVRYRQEKNRLEEDFLAWQRRKEKELAREGTEAPFS